MRFFKFFLFIFLSIKGSTALCQSGIEGFPHEGRDNRKALREIQSSPGRRNPSSAETKQDPKQAQTNTTDQNLFSSFGKTGIYDSSTQLNSVWQNSEELEKNSDLQFALEEKKSNKIEIEFAPFMAYNDSLSSYSFRNYHSLFQGVSIKPSIWFNQNIGLGSKFLLSIGSNIEDVNQTKVATRYENLEVQFNYRRFLGESQLSKSLMFSFLVNDSSTKISNESTLHPRLNSHGIGVGLSARLPLNQNFVWLVGSKLYPHLQHYEYATSVAVNSGNSSTNSRIGFQLGGEWSLARQNILVLDFSYDSENNNFNGPANLPDSSTGQTPTNVGINNSLYLISLGYRWGH